MRLCFLIDTDANASINPLNLSCFYTYIPLRIIRKAPYFRMTQLFIREYYDSQ